MILKYYCDYNGCSEKKWRLAHVKKSLHTSSIIQFSLFSWEKWPAGVYASAQGFVRKEPLMTIKLPLIIPQCADLQSRTSL